MSKQNTANLKETLAALTVSVKTTEELKKQAQILRRCLYIYARRRAHTRPAKKSPHREETVVLLSEKGP